jgi:hypothetical protein
LSKKLIVTAVVSLALGSAIPSAVAAITGTSSVVRPGPTTKSKVLVSNVESFASSTGVWTNVVGMKTSITKKVRGPVVATVSAANVLDQDSGCFIRVKVGTSVLPPSEQSGPGGAQFGYHGVIAAEAFTFAKTFAPGTYTVLVQMNDPGNAADCFMKEHTLHLLYS